MSPTFQPLIELLTTKLRCLRREQAERLWFGHVARPATSCRQFLKRLERTGLIHLTPVLARPELAMRKPLLDWRPGRPAPNFDRLAWQAESRLVRPAAGTLLITATKKTQRLTGGPIGRRPLRSAEINHDLMVAGIFELFIRERHERASTWLPEDAIVQERCVERQSSDATTIPDAIVVRDGDEIVIEIAGRYGAKKLRTIHEAYQERRYELW